MVCLRRTDGSLVVPLGAGELLAVSHDGRWALAAVPTSPAQLMVYPTGAGQSRQLDRGNLIAYVSGDWFADDKRLLVCGNEAGRAVRCYVQDVSGGPPRAVTPEGTGAGLISPDGKLVLATGRQAWQLYPVEGGAPTAVPGVQAGDTAVRWSAAGRSIVVLVGNQIPARFERISLLDGRRQLLFSIAPADRTGVVNFEISSVSEDEKYYAYTYRQIDASLFLVDNEK